MKSLSQVQTVLFDVDGTLVDSNAAHAESWAQALGEHGIDAKAADVRPLVGMGGDKVLPKLADIESTSERGKKLSERKKALFNERLPRLQATRGARSLVEFLKARGIVVAIATSAQDEEMQAILRQAKLDDLFTIHATKDDAAESKPDPDIVLAALDEASADRASTVMIGDTPYDIEAARRAGVEVIALRCGGHWKDEDFAGAIGIFDDPAALLADWQAVTASFGD